MRPPSCDREERRYRSAFLIASSSVYARTTDNTSSREAQITKRTINHPTIRLLPQWLSHIISTTIFPVRPLSEAIGNNSKESPPEQSTETVLNNANRGAPNGTSLYSAARSKHAESLMDDGDGEVGYVNPPKYRRRRIRQTDAPNEWAAADQACSGSAASSASPSASSSSLFRPKSTGEELFSHGSSHGS